MDIERLDFTKEWCSKNNVDIENLTDEQINKLCCAWTFKKLGIEFKTIDEWRLKNE